CRSSRYSGPRGRSSEATWRQSAPISSVSRGSVSRTHRAVLLICDHEPESA
ncbi:MAG: hypothetical protein AVDCRST_MAG17-1085, partial [uncultured Solirubrobacterales bacterium]